MGSSIKKKESTSGGNNWCETLGCRWVSAQAQKIRTEPCKVLSLPWRAENKHSISLPKQDFGKNWIKLVFVCFKTSSTVNIVWDRWKRSEGCEQTCVMVLLPTSWWGQCLNVQRSWSWLFLFLSIGDSVHPISLVVLQCCVGAEVVVGTTNVPGAETFSVPYGWTLVYNQISFVEQE